MTSRGKRYTLKQVSDFLDIPKDKIDDCLMEFKTFIEFSQAMGDIGKVVEPDMAVSKMLKGSHFIWIDDGKHDLRKITITTPSEGKKEASDEQ